MLGRRNHKPSTIQKEGDGYENDSLSTSPSESPKSTNMAFFSNKEKSELCRKFMEFGYCPYQKKCKFAHGCHELKKNNTTNSKYKTK